MKYLKMVGWVVILLLIIIQFFPSELPPSSGENEHDLIQTAMIPDQVALILKTSCYDCHSNETNYPWYAYIAPARWLVVKDIREGRDDLNFSDWNQLEVMDRIKVLDEVAEEVEEGNMPMPVYTLLHWDAKLNPEQKEILINWTGQMMNDMLGE